jgi:alkylation response protein AidB-like acyl-CoA dehydrogenase
MTSVTANHSSNCAGDDTEMLALLTESVVDFCTRALPRSRLRTQREQVPPFSRDAFREMAKLGWLGLVVDEVDGGLGLGVDAVVRVCRELGRVLAAEPYIESALAGALLLAASPAARAARDTVMTGGCIAAAPLTPTAWREATAAVRVDVLGKRFRLNGVLPQFPLAPDADLLLVPATYDGEASLFAVPRESSGVTIEPLTVADGTRDGRVTLTAAPCGADAPLLRGVALASARDHALAVAGIGASAYLQGACEALFGITIEHLRTRKQFGRAIGSFQALQHRAVDLYGALRLTGAALNAAIDTSRDHGNLALAAARARRRAIATAQTMIREGIQLHGAIGYTDEYDVSLFVHRVLVLSARFGGAEQELFAVPAIARGELGATDEGLPPDERLPLNFHPANGDWNAVGDATFRDLVRRWVETHYPENLRHPPAYVRWTVIRDWHLALVERGWGAPAWPREFGGMGLDAAKMIIFIEELERWGVARAPDQGIVTVAPILFEYGNDDQRARFLNRALRGDDIWCQGYSEPNAGSDLASLTTSAVLEGDEFIVNGQKTWTTHGVDATHMYCLVRTERR